MPHCAMQQCIYIYIYTGADAVHSNTGNKRSGAAISTCIRNNVGRSSKYQQTNDIILYEVAAMESDWPDSP